MLTQLEATQGQLTAGTHAAALTVLASFPGWISQRFGETQPSSVQAIRGLQGVSTHPLPGLDVDGVGYSVVVDA